MIGGRRLVYIRILYNIQNLRKRIYLQQNQALHAKQELGTSCHFSEILYITENRNFVQYRKKQFCTTQKKRILYITYKMSFACFPSIQFTIGSTSFFMIKWTPNACRDVSKCQISIATLMTHNFYNAPNVCVPSIQFTTEPQA